MSRRFPVEFLKSIDVHAAIAGQRKVARRFVPGYASGAAIRLAPASPRRTLARRQLARLIERRRGDS